MQPPSSQQQTQTNAVYKPDSGVASSPGTSQTRPDLSHLTPEERKIIEDVINRQRQEENIDRSPNTLSNPTYNVVRRGSKVFQRLPATAAPSMLSSAQVPLAFPESIAETPNVGPMGTRQPKTEAKKNRNTKPPTSCPKSDYGTDYQPYYQRTYSPIEEDQDKMFNPAHRSSRHERKAATHTSLEPTTAESDDICNICHITRFTENAGQICSNCGCRACARCGGWMGNMSAWMCKSCFSNLSSTAPSSTSRDALGRLPQNRQQPNVEQQRNAPPINANTTTHSTIATVADPQRRHLLSHSISGAGRVFQPLTATTQGDSSSSPHTTESSFHATTTSATAGTRGVVREGGYAGVATDPAHVRRSMKSHRSVSEEDYALPQYQRPSKQPSRPYYHRREAPPHYLQQHSSHYPDRGNFGDGGSDSPYGHQHSYPSHSRGPSLAHHTAAPTTEAWWYTGAAHSHNPQPPRSESHHMGPPRCLSGGASSASCGSAEASPRSNDDPRARNTRLQQVPTPGAGWQVPDPGSISEPCHPASQSYASGGSSLRDYGRRTQALSGRMHQYSCDTARPTMKKRHAFWTPSEDGESLVGQVYFCRMRGSSQIGLLKSLGLKLVIGKRVPSEVVGTFVSSVRRGSVADVVGELQTGDEIVEWNGHRLRGLHQAEVSQVLASTAVAADSAAEDDEDDGGNGEVFLLLHRVLPLEEYYGESDGGTTASLSRNCEEEIFSGEEEEEEEEEEEGVCDDGDEEDDGVATLARADADPHLQLKLRYDEEKATLVVSVLAARDLPPLLRDSQSWLCNAFCRIYIRPETSQDCQRFTKVIRSTNDPVWIQNFTFESLPIHSRELEVTVFDYVQNRSLPIGDVLIDLQVADLSGRDYWYPIPLHWDTTDQELSSQMASESGTCEADEWSGMMAPRVTAPSSVPPSLRNMSPRSVPALLSFSSGGRLRRQSFSHQSQQRRQERRSQDEETPQNYHRRSRGGTASTDTSARGQPPTRPTRYTVSEDDQSFLSDNSDASGFSGFSKLSLQSNQLRQQLRQRLGTTTAATDSGRSTQRRRATTDPPTSTSDQYHQRKHPQPSDAVAPSIAITGGPMGDGSLSEDYKSPHRTGNEGSQRPGPPLDDQRSSSPILKSDEIAATPSARLTAAGALAQHKRGSGIGQRFSNVLGISKKNANASGTDKKKTKTSFQRSEEVLPAHIASSTNSSIINEKRPGGGAGGGGLGSSAGSSVSGGYKAPGAVAKDAGFGGIAGSCTITAATSALSGSGGARLHHPKVSIGGVGGGMPRQMSASTIASSSASTYNDRQTDLDVGEVHVGEFVEGLGPGQLVGRQVLGMPCLGEIQLSFFDRKGHLEVEVIRARGLQQKNTSKPLPTPYVKLYLLEGKQPVEKMRTTTPARRTLDPLFQQQFSFSTSVYKDKILQVSVWGEYGRMDKKVFLGMCEIVLDDLSLRSIVFGWYKLFGMIAATAQHHKQPRARHGSGAAASLTSAQQKSASSKRRASKSKT